MDLWENGSLESHFLKGILKRGFFICYSDEENAFSLLKWIMVKNPNIA